MCKQWSVEHRSLFFIPTGFLGISAFATLFLLIITSSLCLGEGCLSDMPSPPPLTTIAPPCVSPDCIYIDSDDECR